VPPENRHESSVVNLTADEFGDPMIRPAASAGNCLLGMDSTKRWVGRGEFGWARGSVPGRQRGIKRSTEEPIAPTQIKYS